MPVEIWSRFMRDAHQGVPVAGLPSAPRSGGLFSGLFGGGGQAPSPPAPIPVNTPAPQRQTAGAASLDGWMINHLFGGRRN